MDSTEKLLNSYGFTLKNKEFAKTMKHKMDSYPIKKTVLSELYGMEKNTREKILRAFVSESDEIEIGNARTFIKRFRIEEQNISIPVCIAELVRLEIRPTRLLTPISISFKDYTATEELIDEKIANQDPELTACLEEFRLKRTFTPGQVERSFVGQVRSDFTIFLMKLRTTREKREFEEELMTHLFERFAQ